MHRQEVCAAHRAQIVTCQRAFYFDEKGFSIFDCATSPAFKGLLNGHLFPLGILVQYLLKFMNIVLVDDKRISATAFDALKVLFL